MLYFTSSGHGTIKHDRISRDTSWCFNIKQKTLIKEIGEIEQSLTPEKVENLESKKNEVL